MSPTPLPPNLVVKITLAWNTLHLVAASLSTYNGHVGKVIASSTFYTTYLHVASVESLLLQPNQGLGVESNLFLTLTLLAAKFEGRKGD